jgi:hypothetical protein
MRITLITLALSLIAAGLVILCAYNAGIRYESEPFYSKFEDTVEFYGYLAEILPKDFTSSDASIVLVNNGFKCTPAFEEPALIRCYREANVKFCTQYQNVIYPKNKKLSLRSLQIGLPLSCI